MPVRYFLVNLLLLILFLGQSLEVSAQKVRYKNLYLLLQAKVYDQAKPFLVEFLKNNPDHPNANLQMGHTYKSLDMCDSARYFYKRALDLVDSADIQTNPEYYKEFRRLNFRTGKLDIQPGDVKKSIELLYEDCMMSYLDISEVLYLDIDENNTIDAKEPGKILMTLYNKGNAPAKDIEIQVYETTGAKILYSPRNLLQDLPAGHSVEVEISLYGEEGLNEGVASFEISVIEEDLTVIINEFEIQTLDLDTGRITSPVRADPLEEELINRLQSTTYHALLIGIEDYPDDSGIPDLGNPVTDATTLFNLLNRRYNFKVDNMKLLLNSSRSEIIEELELLAERVKEDDNVFIFYAGHGKWDERISQGYWLPSDAKITTRGNWISNDDIRDYINNIQSKHTLLISDACFSGGLLRDAGDSRAIFELYKDRSRKAISSGSLESVPDQSVFLKYLMLELQKSGKPFMSADQLYSSFRNAVINNSPTHQKPLYGVISETGDEGGDFIFFRSFKNN